MTSVRDIFVKTLQENGKSVTSVRLKIFEALNDKEPQTLQELAKYITDIDKASLYRTIQLFEKLGIVNRIQVGWKYKLELSDTYSYHHHHLTCRKCGTIISLREDPSLEARLHVLAGEYGYTDVAHQLEVSGICPTCQKNMDPGIATRV